MFETALDADVAGLHILQVLNATFNPDVGGHGMNCRHVKRGGQADRLRKFRDAGIDHSVKRLAPPVVGWNANPWMARAPFTSCDAFSSSVMRCTRSAARCSGDKLGS